MDSASKARDIGSGSADRRQQELGASLIDTPEEVNEESPFHPAADIFLSGVMNEVSNENKTLEERNSCIRHLSTFIQELNITFNSSSLESHPEYSMIIHRKTVSSSALLSCGSLDLVNDDERFVVPINEAPAHPVDDSGTFGPITGSLCGVPLKSIIGYHKVQYWTDDDGNVIVNMCLSPLVWIEGRLDAKISNDELLAHIETGNFKTCMQMIVPFIHMGNGDTNYPGSYDIGITFTPTLISLLLTPHLKKVLALVKEDAPSFLEDSNENTWDDLHRLVVGVFAQEEHKELLSQNADLKRETANLIAIRDLMLRIDISHSAGALSVSLSKGELSSNGGSWMITLDGIENVSLPVDEIGRINLNFLGERCNISLHETLSTVRGETLPIIFTVFGSMNIIIIGTFNWGDFSEDELAEIIDDYITKLGRVLQGNGDGIFPARLEFKMRGIIFDTLLVKSYLKTAGLWEESA